MVKFPEIEVQLTGVNGNALSIVAAVTRALQDHGVDADTRKTFVDDALSEDYDHVLTTCERWVNVS